MTQSFPEGEEKTLLENINSCMYKVGSHLKRGGCGTIFEGTRIKDKLNVALKYVKKSCKDHTICLPGQPKAVPKEVGLMMLVNKLPRSPNIIQLIDWMEHEDHHVMVLERPLPCMDLDDFVKSRSSSITEESAQTIMRQVIQASVFCCERGVFHRDIKLKNILINSDTLQIKLIDFGCGDLMWNTAYRSYHGTKKYNPPETFFPGMHHAKLATVYSLGVVLYRLMCQKFPSKHAKAQIDFNCWKRIGFSKQCCKFVRGCLQSDPVFRLTLEQLLLHPWFVAPGTESDSDTETPSENLTHTWPFLRRLRLKVPRRVSFYL